MTLDECKRPGKLLIEIEKRTAGLGVQLFYHNHRKTIREYPEQLDMLLDSSDPKYVKLELDTAQSLAGAGDPAKAILEDHDRLLFVHLLEAAAQHVPTPSIAAGGPDSQHDSSEHNDLVYRAFQYLQSKVFSTISPAIDFFKAPVKVQEYENYLKEKIPPEKIYLPAQIRTILLAEPAKFDQGYEVGFDPKRSLDNVPSRDGVIRNQRVGS